MNDYNRVYNENTAVVLQALSKPNIQNCAVCVSGKQRGLQWPRLARERVKDSRMRTHSPGEVVHSAFAETDEAHLKPAGFKE